QDHPEVVWALAFTVHHNPRTLPKIHLSFGARLHLHPHKRDRLCLAQMPDESLYGLVTARECVLTNQILINALGAQPHRHRRLHLRRMRQAKTLATGSGTGGRNGGVWVQGRVLPRGWQWWCVFFG